MYNRIINTSHLKGVYIIISLSSSMALSLYLSSSIFFFYEEYSD